MGERGKVRKPRARISREEVETAVPQRPSSPLQDHEQLGSNEGVKDHASGSGDGEEAQGRSGQEIQIEALDPHPFMVPWDAKVPPVKQYGEQWRGTFNGTTYRMFTVSPSGFMPELLRLQRMYSHPPEDEAWENLWVVA